MHRFISIPLPIPKVPSLFVAVFVIPNELAILALHVCQSWYQAMKLSIEQMRDVGTIHAPSCNLSFSIVFQKSVDSLLTTKILLPIIFSLQI